MPTDKRSNDSKTPSATRKRINAVLSESNSEGNSKQARENAAPARVLRAMNKERKGAKSPAVKQQKSDWECMEKEKERSASDLNFLVEDLGVKQLVEGSDLPVRLDSSVIEQSDQVGLLNQAIESEGLQSDISHKNNLTELDEKVAKLHYNKRNPPPLIKLVKNVKHIKLIQNHLENKPLPSVDVPLKPLRPNMINFTKPRFNIRPAVRPNFVTMCQPVVLLSTLDEPSRKSDIPNKSPVVAVNSTGTVSPQLLKTDKSPQTRTDTVPLQGKRTRKMPRLVINHPKISKLSNLAKKTELSKNLKPPPKLRSPRNKRPPPDLISPTEQMLTRANILANFQRVLNGKASRKEQKVLLQMKDQLCSDNSSRKPSPCCTITSQSQETSSFGDALPTSRDELKANTISTSEKLKTLEYMVEQDNIRQQNVANTQLDSATNDQCSYLNLVNLQPVQRAKFGSENQRKHKRRSHRIKYFVLMQEKKDLEKQLQGTDDELQKKKDDKPGKDSEVEPAEDIKKGKLSLNSRYKHLLDGRHLTVNLLKLDANNEALLAYQTMINNNLPVRAKTHTDTSKSDDCDSSLSSPSLSASVSDELDRNLDECRETLFSNRPQNHIEYAPTLKNAMVEWAYYKFKLKCDNQPSLIRKKITSTDNEVNDQQKVKTDRVVADPSLAALRIKSTRYIFNDEMPLGDLGQTAPQQVAPMSSDGEISGIKTVVQVASKQESLPNPQDGRFSPLENTRIINNCVFTDMSFSAHKKKVNDVETSQYVKSVSTPDGGKTLEPSLEYSSFDEDVGLPLIDMVTPTSTPSSTRTNTPWTNAPAADHTYCEGVVPVQHIVKSPRKRGRPPLRSQLHLQIRRKLAHTLESIRANVEKSDHAAILQPNGGVVLTCAYVDYFLIVAQAERVSFFQQSGLGMFLDSQAMWIPRGMANRVGFDDKCVRKTSRECLLQSPDHGVAYLELFCKEHNHDSRKVPGCDLFVVLYYRDNADNVIRCKVHQLEKFTGYSKNVHFVVTTRSNAVVIYYETLIGTTSISVVEWKLKTYKFSNDYQSVSSVHPHTTPTHRINTLHTIEDCDRMVVGCAGEKMSFWNAEDLLQTIELPVKSKNVTTSFKCDRGFIFALQQPSSENSLRLTAINISSQLFSHKPLQVYRPPPGFFRLRHAIMQEGEIFAFYSKGRVCWNMETGSLMSTCTMTSASWPYGAWLISICRQRVYVKRLWKSMRRRAKFPLGLISSNRV